MKDYFKTIPPLSLIVLYLFVSGGLYLLGFWNTFNLDVLQYVQIWDIPKSVIYPIALSGGITFLISYVRYLFDADGLNTFSNQQSEPKNFIGYFLRLLVSVRGISIILFLSIQPVYMLAGNSVFFWIYVGTVLGFSMILEITFSKIVVALIPNFTIRFIIVEAIIVLPIISFLMGKIHAHYIYINKDVKYINTLENKKINNIFDSTTIKLCGFLGNKVIVSTLDNTKLVVINQEDFNGIIVSDSIIPRVEKNQREKDTTNVKLIY